MEVHRPRCDDVPRSSRARNCPAVNASRRSRARLELEWIADSAGLSLASHAPLSAQGIFLDERSCRDNETTVFETGNGRTTRSSVLYATGRGFVTRDRTSCPPVRLCGPWARLSNQTYHSYGCQISFQFFCKARNLYNTPWMHPRCLKRIRSKIVSPDSVRVSRFVRRNLQRWVSQQRS